MAVFAAVTFGLFMGFLAVRHRALARWNTVAGLAVPVLFLVRVVSGPPCLTFRDFLPWLLLRIPIFSAECPNKSAIQRILGVWSGRGNNRFRCLTSHSATFGERRAKKRLRSWGESNNSRTLLPFPCLNLRHFPADRRGDDRGHWITLRLLGDLLRADGERAGVGQTLLRVTLFWFGLFSTCMRGVGPVVLIWPFSQEIEKMQTFVLVRQRWISKLYESLTHAPG